MNSETFLKVADLKQSAICDLILATGDNSVTAAKDIKKPSVAARMGNRLKRLVS
ncbi:hypothetical protein DPMN_149257 [Dreissena polymorpha]|uniref:Uncharacterized protein n=1 Tax=Dreissena polymorpha TaxID=45954 RepID=A0A9D4FBE3_DREPO|nr:hypothetical protein DPMN_149257 [Dreissena polymorpha]